MLEAFKFIENAAADFSDEDEDEDGEGQDRPNVESRTVRELFLWGWGEYSIFASSLVQR